MNKHSFMETESITKLMIKFSLPAVIGMLVNALYNIVDRIYIGNIKGIGHYAIAGVGLTFPTIIFAFSFSLLIGIGTAANISLYLGEKKFEKAEKYLGVALAFALLSGLAVFLLYFFFIDKILLALGGSDKTFFYAKEYMYTLNFGVPAVIIGTAINTIIRSDGSPKTSMGTLLIGAITNIILDPIFIFYFDMGVRGAATATIISQYISAIWTLYYFVFGRSRIKLKLKNITLDFVKMKKIAALGSSAFAVQIGFSVVQYILNLRLKKYGGDLSIAAMAIVQSIVSFMVMPILGINQGVLPILGYNYGAKRYERVKETLFKGIFAATCICITGYILCMLFSAQLIRIFTNDKELIDIASYGIKRHVFAFPIIGFQIVSSIYFQAIGKPKLSFVISLSRQILILIPCLFIMSTIFGLTGIWYATPTSDLLSTMITFTFIRKEIKNLNKIQEINESLDNN